MEPMNFKDAWLVDCPIISFDVYITRIRIIEALSNEDELRDDYNGFY